MKRALTTLTVIIRLGAKLTRNILKRLKFDNETTDQVERLVYWHDTRTQPEERLVRRAVYRIGEDLFPRLLKLQYADTMAQSGWYRQEKLRRLEEVGMLFEKNHIGAAVYIPEDVKAVGRGPYSAWHETGTGDRHCLAGSA